MKEFYKTRRWNSSGLLWRILRRCTGIYHKWFCQRNYIFKHESPFPPEKRSDCIFKCYNSIMDLPESIQADISSEGAPHRLERDIRELRENALLWVALVKGRVAATVFTRRGKFFRNWFLPLQPDDVVVFRLRTHPDYRGRGLAPSLIRHAMHETVQSESAHAYIDCRTYNKASAACIRKAGFHCIAKMKTISRDWALYGRDVSKRSRHNS